MTTYSKNTEDRKTIANRIGELTGEKLKYTMPGYTYQGQGFTVTREGNLEADESADKAVIDTLIEEGLILAAAGETAADTAKEEPEESEAAGSEESGAEGLTISLPLEGHTGASLRNLISMLYARGRLISKATGGSFGCTEELSKALKEEACILTTDSLKKAVADFEAENGKALTGLSFEEGKVSFTGFPATEDPDKVTAFQQLACQMSKLAKEQKRTLAREVDESNERYIFRIWLLRLGLEGPDFKTARKVLLAPLSGNAAFKDSAMEERWKEKQNAKREALKAAKAETGVTDDEASA